MKGKIDAYGLCTVTFAQKVPKLNSRLVYCSRLYGIYFFEIEFTECRKFKSNNCQKFQFSLSTQSGNMVSNKNTAVFLVSNFILQSLKTSKLKNVSVPQRQSLLFRKYFQFFFQQCFSNSNLRQVSVYISISIQIKSNIASIHPFFSALCLKLHGPLWPIYKLPLTPILTNIFLEIAKS